MKKLVIPFVLCFAMQVILAQNNQADQPETYRKEEVIPPQFTGINKVNVPAEAVSCFQ